MIIAETATPSARLQGLGSKQYPSNMQRMLNKDLTWFLQSPSRVRQKSRKRKEGSAYQGDFMQNTKKECSL